jgi:hypothetical protein
MRLANTSASATVGLTSVTPFFGTVWGMQDNIRENLHETGGVPCRVGWMQDTEWGHEGNFQAAVRTWHRYLRRHVLARVGDGRRVPAGQCRGGRVPPAVPRG